MNKRLTGAVLALAATPALLAGQAFETPTPPPEATQFDYLLGDWTFSAVWKTPDGEGHGTGTWSARKALDGFGVIDEWRVLAGPGGPTVYFGTSVRMYDPAERRWNMRFLDVFGARWEEQFAEWRDGEMHVWWSGEAEEGPYQMRVVYYDITPDRFRWRGDRSHDGGATWIENWLTMEVTRVAKSN